MGDLPTGTVTLLFADIEQSTALLLRLGAKRYGAALAEYQRVVRQAVESNGGVLVDAEGDGFFAAFPSAEQAVSGAAQSQAALAECGLRVRMGMHTGEPLVVDGRYRGIAVRGLRERWTNSSATTPIFVWRSVGSPVERRTGRFGSRSGASRRGCTASATRLSTVEMRATPSGSTGKVSKSASS